MKKILATTALIALISASIAYAAGVVGTDPTDAWAIGDGSGTATIDATGVGENVTCKIKLSANVAAYYVGSANNYAITTAHASGSKSFASMGSDNRIYMRENPAPDKNTYVSDTSKTEPWKIDSLDSPDTAFDGWTAVK